MTLKPVFRQIILKGRNVIMGMASIAVLSACATTQAPPKPMGSNPSPTRPVVQLPQTPVQTGQPEQRPTETQTPIKQIVTRDGLTPPHMQGQDIVRLALLLPFSSQSDRLRAEATSMFKAAEMAVFSHDDANILLISVDTGGTEQGASSAARTAIKSGADVILGPILARSVAAVSAEARQTQTPVIAFSTDQTVAGNGTYLLSFPPEAEIKRIVEYTATTGVKHFAFLGPQSTYGQRVLGAYQTSVQRVNGQITASETYNGSDISVMQEPAKRLATFYKNHKARNGNRERAGYEAILLPEGGTPLRSLAPLLPYYDIDPVDVQFLGTGLWHKEEVVREPALNGGIFAGPPEDGRKNFKDSFDQQYGEEASSLASLAFDAVSVGAIIAEGNPRGRRARAEDPSGFFGVDGLVRFNADGTPDRGLAVYQIKNGKFVVIDPAPRSPMGPS